MSHASGLEQLQELIDHYKQKLTAVPMGMGQKYCTCQLDLRAKAFRAKAQNNPIRDLCTKTMRWALHLSDREAEALERLNPDTLGRHDDEKLRGQYWADFISRPESAPFRIQERV